MTENNDLLPIDIIDVESKPDNYDKRVRLTKVNYFAKIGQNFPFLSGITIIFWPSVRLSATLKR